MTASHDPFLLRSSLTSPFVRKVRMVAEVLGLTDRILLVPTDAADPDDSLRQENPLGQYPCLVTPGGEAIYDSSVILEFLQDVAGTSRLLPHHGAERISALTRTRLADGIINAGALIIYEARYHEPHAQSEKWLSYQREKILRALAAFERDLPDPRRTDAVSIGLACALGFLDRRQPVEWRPQHPGLVAWLDAFAEHEPAFQRTKAPEA